MDPPWSTGIAHISPLVHKDIISRASVEWMSVSFQTQDVVSLNLSRAPQAGVKPGTILTKFTLGFPGSDPTSMGP